MLKSYLAIIDASGLRCIYEESDHSTRILTQELSSSANGDAILVWAVARDDSYRHVSSALSIGMRRDAWRQLQYSAEQMGAVGVVG